MAHSLSFSALVDGRRAELGLSEDALIARLGYTDFPKGRRRLAALREGNLGKAAAMIPSLARALELPRSTLIAALAGEEGAALRPCALTGSVVPFPGRLVTIMSATSVHSLPEPERLGCPHAT